MSAAGGPQLQVVEPVEEPIYDDVEGVIEYADPRWQMAWRLREKEADCKRLENDLRSKRAQITKLQREKLDADEAERRANPSREFIESLFDRWREGTGHKRSKLTPERFDMAADRLTENYTEADLSMAVEGLIVGFWTTPQGERKDDWKVALKEGSQVEAYANKCPAEKRREITGTLFEVAS